MPKYIMENVPSANMGFIADNTQKFLALAGVTNLSMSDSNGVFIYLPAGDNFFIKEIGLFVPYQYSIGSGTDCIVELNWINRAGTANGSWTEFGDSNGRVIIPEFNYWHELNTFLPYPAAALGGDIIIRLTLVNCEISQLNAPTALNGDDIRSTFAMRVESNFLLTA